MVVRKRSTTVSVVDGTVRVDPDIYVTEGIDISSVYERRNEIGLRSLFDVTKRKLRITAEKLRLPYAKERSRKLRMFHLPDGIKIQ